MRGLRLGRTWITIVVVLALFGAVNFVPPDTSLAVVRSDGVLRACVPDRFPPLVMGDDAREAPGPGIDVELLREVADRMGVRLALNTNSSIGRDFNPRNWRVTRAQCSVIAGGVVNSPSTRSFLETTPPYLGTGWAMVASDLPDTLDGVRVGFFAGVVGLDRIALSRFLREQGATPAIVGEASALVAGLREGRFDVGITESLTARRIAGENGWSAHWLPPALERHAIVWGLWRGDLTLKREIVGILRSLERSGAVDAIVESYALEPISEGCPPCASDP